MPEDAMVLVVEDDADIRQGLRAVLRRAGYRVTEAGDGRVALRVFHESRPDVVVLDVGLPDMSGWVVLERIRDLSDAPVIMLTARGLETEKVRGLSAGADDYVTKPFGTQEIVARIAAVLRRYRSQPGAEPAEQRYVDHVLTVDPATFEVLVEGTPVAVTPTELRLLYALARHRGQVLSPDQLLMLAWRDPSGVGAERVKFTVSRLRRKLGWGDDGPLETVRGVGYRYRRSQ